MGYLIVKSRKNPTVFIKHIEQTKYEEWAFFAFLFLTLGLIFIVFVDQNLGVSLCAMGIAFISVAIGIKAILLGKKAIQLGKKSDEKMKAIANVNFQEISDRFVNRRLELHKNPLIPYEMELTAWKCRNYLDSANELKKWVKKKIQENFVTKYINLINTYPWKGTSFFSTKGEIKINKNIIALIDVKNIVLMYSSLRKLNIDNALKAEPIKSLEPYIGKRKRNESIDKYLERKNEEISKEIQLKHKRHPFNKDEVGKKLKKGEEK